MMNQAMEISILRSVRFVLFFATFLGAAGMVRSDDDSVPAKVTRETWIEDTAAGGLRAIVDLGDLPVGRTSHVAVILRNSLKNAIPVTAISTSCSCIKITSKKGEVPANGEFLVEFDIDVPSKANKVEQSQLFTLFETEDRGISVAVDYRIAGLVSFLGTGFSTKAAFGSREHKFEIPFLVTKPASISSLRVHADESLGNIEMVPLQRDGQALLACRVSLEGDLEQGRSGNIQISDSELGSTGTTLCLIELKQLLIVAPTVLRFSMTTTEDKQFSATAIAQLDETILGEKVEPLFTFATEIGNLTSHSRKLAAGIYRVNLTWKPKDSFKTISDLGSEDFPLHAFCTVKTGIKTERKKLKIHFEL